MENFCEKERLNSIRNEMTHLWGSIFVTAGGTIALLLDDRAGIMINSFIVLGFCFTIIMINAYFVRRTEVLRIIKSLEETS